MIKTISLSTYKIGYNYLDEKKAVKRLITVDLTDSDSDLVK